MRILVAILLLLAQAAHAGQSAPLNGWLASDTDSKAVPLRRDAGDLITLQFPSSSTRPPKVCVLAQAITGSITGKTLTISFKIVADPSVFWWGGFGGTCDFPPNLRLFFTTKAGNFDYNYSTKYPNSYWWSNSTITPMGSVDDGAIYTLSAPLTSTGWGNAFGQSVSADFNVATTHPLQVGLAFGRGCFGDTGVDDYYGDGAVLHVESLTVQ